MAKVLAGKTVALEVEHSVSIENIEAKIAERQCIPSEQCVSFFGARSSRMAVPMYGAIYEVPRS